MKVSIQKLSIGNFEWLFFFDYDHHPAIEVNGKKYISPGHLFMDFPLLSLTQHLDKSAQLINFLLKGLEYHYIENIETFKQTYYQKNDINCLNINHLNVIEDGQYDVSMMHAPCLKNGQLTFFVKHDYSQIPYQVNITFPFSADPLQANYTLLPYL